MVFGRVLTAMVTPFNEQMEVDYEQAKKLACYLVEHGNDGLVVAGTTGESPTLSAEEKIKLFKVVKEAVGDKALVIAGTGSYDTMASIKLTKEAEKVGVDGIMLVVPYYSKPSQEGLYQHFKTIAAETKLPVLLYNIPGRTGINMEPETIARLSEIDNIVAVKEASGKLDQVSKIRALAKEDFVIYSGDDSLTLPILAVGGYGIISVVGHVAGEQIREMVQLYLDGQVEAAAKMHIKLYDLFKTMFITANPVPIKYALNLKGMNVGPVRLPLVEANDKEKASIKACLEKLELLEASPKVFRQDLPGRCLK